MRLLLLGLALVAAACDTTTDLTRLNVGDLSHDPAALVGTWDLISQTSPGDGGPPTTAPVTGDQTSYTFDADGTARIAYSGETVETTWEVGRRGGLAKVPPSLYLGTRQIRFGIDGDRLYFDSRIMDGPLQEFARR